MKLREAQVRGEVGAGASPLAVVVAFSVGDGALDDADLGDGGTGAGPKVLEERDGAFDVEAEVKNVGRVEDVVGFSVDLTVGAEDAGVDAGVVAEIVGGFGATVAEAVGDMVVFCSEPGGMAALFVEGGVFGADGDNSVGRV